jgi:hypothetical protein
LKENKKVKKENIKERTGGKKEKGTVETRK